MDDFGSSIAHLLHRLGVWLIVLVVVILGVIGVSAWRAAAKQSALESDWERIQNIPGGSADALREAIDTLEDPTGDAWKHGMIRLGWTLLRDERYQHAKGAFDRVIDASRPGTFFYDYARFGKATVLNATGDDSGEGTVILAELAQSGTQFLVDWAKYEQGLRQQVDMVVGELTRMTGEAEDVPLAPADPEPESETEEPGEPEAPGDTLDD